MAGTGISTPNYNLGNFTNPQRIIDNSFDVFVEGGQKMVNKVATTADQIYKRNAEEKASQKIEWEKQNEEQQKLYSSVNELGSTGSSSLDSNLRGYWEERVESYTNIMNAMQRGELDQQKGNRMLAKINGEVNKFKTVVPYLASQVALQQEAGKLPLGTAGAISSTTSTESQEVLNNLVTGGDTGLVNRGGTMFLYNPAIKGVQQAGMLNLDELIANQASGKSIIHTVPDISKDLAGAFQNIFKPDDSQSPYVKFRVDKNQDGSGYDYTYKEINDEDKALGIQAMKDANQFNGILNNNIMMTSVWQDIIPDEYLAANGVDVDSSWGMTIPGGTAAESIALQEKMRGIAADWLAEEAYNQNSVMDQNQKFVSRKKTEKKAPKCKVTTAQYQKAWRDADSGEMVHTDAAGGCKLRKKP